MRIFAKFSMLLEDKYNLNLEIEKIKQQIKNNSDDLKLVFALLDKLIDKILQGKKLDTKYQRNKNLGVTLQPQKK